MTHYRLLIIAMLLLAYCTSPKTDNPHVEITTRFGNVEIELFPKQAPVTVAAFLSYIDSGYYNKSSFYRVLLDDNIHSFNHPSKRRIPLTVRIIFTTEIVTRLVAYADKKFGMGRTGRQSSQRNRSIGVRQFRLLRSFVWNAWDLA